MIRVAEIRERLERSDYEIDTRLVAEAIVDRLAAGATPREPHKA